MKSCQPYGVNDVFYSFACNSIVLFLIQIYETFRLTLKKCLHDVTLIIVIGGQCGIVIYLD